MSRCQHSFEDGYVYIRVIDSDDEVDVSAVVVFAARARRRQNKEKQRGSLCGAKRLGSLNLYVDVLVEEIAIHRFFEKSYV